MNINPARAGELMQTMHSPGWDIAMNIAEEAVKEAEDAVWNCRDKSNRDDLVLKAQAAREFLKDFKSRVLSAQSLSAENPNYSFHEVAID
jgi:hypothetical protein